MERHGVGKHQWDVPLSEVPNIVKASMLGGPSYGQRSDHLQFGRHNSIVLPPTMLCVKLSLLLLYLRIFAPDKVTRYLIYIGMTVCIGAYTTLMFLAIFANVVTIIATNKALGVVNLSSDVYILCVPMAAIMKLPLSTKKKIGVILIFMAGTMYVASFSDGVNEFAHIFTALVP